MIRILHSVSNMDRAGIETMLMNYYRHIDRSKIQFDFLCNKKKPGAYDAEIKEMGGNIYHTPGLNPAKYPSYLKCMKKIFEENPEYKIVEAHNGALGVYALHAAKVNHIPVRIFHAHGASITRDWKLPIKLVCKALLPSNMNQHFSCGIEAARCYFGEKVVERNDYELIPNAIEVNRFVFDSTIRNRIRHDNHLENKHIVGHVGRFMSQKNHTFLLDVFAEVSKRDSLAHLVLLGDGELMDAMKEKASNLGIKDRVTFVGNSQLFNLLCDKADDVYNGRLPVHVRCLLDEFANIGQIPKFDKLIATIRSREISASIILQSQSQLKTIYKDAADTITGNCDCTLFLGGKEKSTLKEISEVLGKETIDLYNTSETRSNNNSYGLNYQKTGKELMSQDEIAVMDGAKCILQLRGVRPFLSNKYDITKHPKYRQLSDYDKRNAFDIEKYRQHKLVVKPDDTFDLYDMGEVDAD